jgi:hypothetical protein
MISIVAVRDLTVDDEEPAATPAGVFSDEHLCRWRLQGAAFSDEERTMRITALQPLRLEVPDRRCHPGRQPGEHTGLTTQ